MEKVSLDLDPRTLATVKWSAVWNAVGGAIESVFGFLSFYFIGGVAGEFLRAFGGFAQTFPVNELLRAALWGAVYGAVFGFIISKFYSQIQQLNKQYLKGKLNTFFKLLFYPSLVGSLIGFFLSSAAAFSIGLMPLFVILAGVILSSYVYAKMMDKYVGSLYASPTA